MARTYTRRTVLAAAAAASGLAAVPAANAQLQIEITGVGANQTPIALVPMTGSSATQIDPMQIVASDLSRTGAFRTEEAPDELSFEDSLRPDLQAWSKDGVALVATGSVAQAVDGRWDIRYRLFDTTKGLEPIDEASYLATTSQLRMVAHRIADRIYDCVTGFGAMFASRIAYVVEHNKKSYELIVADSDGANARAALKSTEPIISPAWSPDGQELAYVSFEMHKPVVYVHTVATGKRRTLANFWGNNSAPAFSPDGNQVALALSRDGFTQIFIINTDGSGVRRFSRSLAIDTEPVYSIDGKFMYFTSDRGGTPQIYRQPIDGDHAVRVTFASDYAVSPSVNPAGTHLTYVTRLDGRYRVAVLDIASGQETVVSKTDRDESPCFSPNGRMIVYASERAGKGLLATVSVDGTVSAWLTGPKADIREPTWGPLIKETE